MKETEHDAEIALARLCSTEWLDNAAIQHYLESSPSARHFRNRITAARNNACHNVLLRPGGESSSADVRALHEAFDEAREIRDVLVREFTSWLNIIERWDGKVPGFEWKTQKHRAALAGIEVIEADRDLARAQRAVRDRIPPATVPPASQPVSTNTSQATPAPAAPAVAAPVTGFGATGTSTPSRRNRRSKTGQSVTPC